MQNEGREIVGMKQTCIALSCLLVVGTIGCADMTMLGGLSNKTPDKSAMGSNLVIVDFGCVSGRTISIALPTVTPAQQTTQSMAHQWVVNDIFQYEVILSREGQDIATATVFPKNGQSGAKFVRLQAGFIYKVRVIARGNVGGTDPDVVLNSQHPAIGMFDFTNELSTAPQTVEITVSLDSDDRTGIVNITPLEGSVQASAGAEVDELTLSPVMTLFAENPLLSHNVGGIVSDAEGTIYLSDWAANAIRKISAAGEVTTLAGNPNNPFPDWQGYGYADGKGTEAKFNRPQGMAIDPAGNLYIADSYNKCIRMVTPGGTVSTYYGGTAGTSGAYVPDGPLGLVRDSNGNLYVSDSDRIYKISPSRVSSLVAGSQYGYADGIGAAAKFATPQCLTRDESGNLYVADMYNNCIRKISPDGIVTTLAGSKVSGFVDGDGATARFYHPIGITYDGMGNLYVADAYNSRIRRVSLNGTVSTLTTQILTGFMCMNGNKTLFAESSHKVYKLQF